MSSRVHPIIPLAWWQVIAITVLLAALVVIRVGPGVTGADRAMELAPEDTLVYVQVSLDEGSEQYQRLTELAARFPASREIRDSLGAVVSGPEGEPVDLDGDVLPWLGDEIALAVVPGGGEAAQSVLLLEADDEDGARELLGSFESEPRTAEYRDVEVLFYGDDFVAGIVDGFLAIGQRASIRRAIDIARGEDPSLADADLAERAYDGLPGGAIAEAYASAEGVREVLAQQDGILRQLAQVVDRPALEATAASIFGSEDGVELASYSVLDPEVSRRQPGADSDEESFTPELPSQVPHDALFYFGVPSFERTLDSLLAQAIVALPSAAEGFERFRRDLGRRTQVDVQSELLPLLEGEAAIAITPGTLAPVVTLIVDDVDEDRTQRALAALQEPLAAAITPGESQQAPTFNERDIEGVRAFSVSILPTVELTYAVFDGRLAVSTSPDGIERLRVGGEGLDSSALWQTTLPGHLEDVSSVFFLDLESLIGLAEGAGLGTDPAYQERRADIQRLRALGMTVAAQDDELGVRIVVAIR